MIEGGVIKVDKATGKPIPGSKAALVYGQMNEPPGARARVALTGNTPHYITIHSHVHIQALFPPNFDILLMSLTWCILLCIQQS